MDDDGGGSSIQHTVTSSMPPETATTLANINRLVRRLFCPVVVFGQIWGIVAMCLAITWMKSYGGFGWDVDRVFNYHPVLLTVGMVYLQGQAILVYRLFRYKPKRILKLCHAILHLSVFSMACVGLVAVFKFHELKKIPDLYSLHSWVGLVLVVSYGMQLLFGFSVYLLPFASLRVRMLSMPLHRSFGLLMFGLAGATAVMGITEKAIFSSKDCWVSRSCNLADVINWMGLSIGLYVMSVLYLVITPEYKRIPLSTD